MQRETKSIVENFAYTHSDNLSTLAQLNGR